jgi:hypothetical protein
MDSMTKLIMNKLLTTLLIETIVIILTKGDITYN